ncbi:hypothetical protein B0533_12910 [Sedimentibacter sp. SX930]|nr:hypothetical protein B0533_12910 [Sedimentibacter sp. SX930]
MSDSMIRVGRRGSNFIDANLLVFPKKKYPKIKKSARKKAGTPKGKNAKSIVVNGPYKEKRTHCLIKYSQMIADDLENQGKYKRMFYAFYPDYPTEHFKKFVNMYFAIVKNKKLKYVSPSREIVHLLLYFNREAEHELLMRFINKLYRFESEHPNSVTLRVKKRCNQLLSSRNHAEVFDITMG